MAACPCGGRAGCACTPLQRRRYRSRLTSELGSYISIWLSTAPFVHATSARGEDDGDADVISAACIVGARDRARHRFRDERWKLNSDIPGIELHRSLWPTSEAFTPVNRAVDLGEISAHAAHQVVRVAWTLADLADIAGPGSEACGQALAFQLGVAR
jgi:magnesium chelatase family protein